MATDGSAVQPVTEDPKEASDKCNHWVDRGLTKNSAIQFLVQQLVDLGCTPPERFIKCVQCDVPAAGGFGILQETRVVKAATTTACDGKMKADVKEMLQREQSGSSQLSVKPEIYLCQQYMADELMVHKTLVHELIHAIDMCRTKMDPLHNCVHMACTEIRAENLSGECSVFKELPRMQSFKGHGQECVKRRAILSVRANPNCTERAEEYVTAAMPRCFQDVYPFDRHPNLR